MTLDFFPGLPWFLLRRRQQKIRMASSAKAATPPSTPPMIAPRFGDVVFGRLTGVLDAEGAPWVAARTEDNAVMPVAVE